MANCSDHRQQQTLQQQTQQHHGRQQRAPRRNKSPKTGSRSFEPSGSEVLAAVRSLYKDQLKPFGRILLKRLRERAAISAAGGGGRHSNNAFAFVSDEAIAGVAQIDPKFLRRLCDQCPQLAVEPAEGREYAVLLKSRPQNFVDVCAKDDTFSEELWLELRHYFEALGDEEASLPGGRYACAQVLVGRHLKCLKGLTLGQVCRIVQLSVSQKKILGYRQGSMVPYGRSEESLKEHCAAHQVAVCSGAGGAASGSEPNSAPSLNLASWSQVRSCLKTILETSSNPAPGTVTMSNVKRLFRSRFDLELSETALGYSRLYELLCDPRLSDVCEVRSRGNGQAVVQRSRHAGHSGGACGGSGHGQHLSASAPLFTPQGAAGAGGGTGSCYGYAQYPGAYSGSGSWELSSSEQLCFDGAGNIAVIAVPGGPLGGWTDDSCGAAWAMDGSGYLIAPGCGAMAHDSDSSLPLRKWSAESSLEGEPSMTLRDFDDSVPHHKQKEASLFLPLKHSSLHDRARMPAKARVAPLQSVEICGAVESIVKQSPSTGTSGSTSVGHSSSFHSSSMGTPSGSRERTPGRCSWADLTMEDDEDDSEMTKSAGTSMTAAAAAGQRSDPPSTKLAKCQFQFPQQGLMVRNTFIDVKPDRSTEACSVGSRSKSVPRLFAREG